MQTQCSNPHELQKLLFDLVGSRRVEADFTAGQVSSDGGGLLLREVEKKLGLIRRLSTCFTDHRDPELVEHTVEQILSQRIFAIALGYEDLNDHEALSRDPLLATLVGKEDICGIDRRNSKDAGQALASPATLGRFERTGEQLDSKNRYQKIVFHPDQVIEVFLTIFIESFKHPPGRLILDFDPSDIKLHGQQEQRFYHGYYRHHCYLPMYAFCGQYPLLVSLRSSNRDGAEGTVELLAIIVERLRRDFPDTHLIVRGDSGFCREELMVWCEANSVDFVFGLARNTRLEKELERQMERARREHLQTERAARRFRDFRYSTLKSWSHKRRVIGKAEYLFKGANPRFVVTSLAAKQFECRYVYEELYCARGEMENRIKEQQLDLFGDRASGHEFKTNSLRVWLSAAAHLLIVGLRQMALEGTDFARAQTSTLRTKLLKVGALVRVSVRRIYIQLSSAFPYKEVMTSALRRLRAAPCR